MTVQKLKNEIKKSRSVLVTAHRNPDADAVSSLAFVLALLQKKGKVLYYHLAGEINLKWKDIVSGLPGKPYKGEAVDISICLDSTSPERFGEEIIKGVVINIDHHVSNRRYGDINHVMPDMSSTAEIVYYLFKDEIDLFDDFMKEMILLGILGDTGFLKYDNATESTFQAVSALMSSVPLFDIYQKYYQVLTMEHFDYFSFLISKMKEGQDGIYYISLDFEELEDSSLNYDEISELFAWFRPLKDAEVLLFFREFQKGIFRINFRGNNNIDLNKIARLYGGGGHRNAAAASIEGDLDDILPDVFQSISDGMKDE